jgi:MFS family permease
MKKTLLGILIWFLTTLFVLYAFFLNTAASVFAGPIKQYLKATDAQTALAVGSFILGFACMQIPAGYLLDRFRIRFVVSGGLFLLALGNLTLSLSTNLGFFALSNFVQGLGASFAFLAVGKLISQWFSPKTFPILFGLTQTLSCVLAAVIHYYLVIALETVTWQTVYEQLALMGFILLVLTFIFVKSPGNLPAESTVSFGKSLSLVLKNKQIWLCSLGAATSFGVLAAYGSFWYLKIQHYYLVNTPEALVISGMVFGGIGIGTPFLGWLSNKLHSRNLIIHFSLVLGSLFLLMEIYLPHFNIQTFIPIKITSFLAGFFLSGSMLFYTCINELSTQNTRAVALGLINTCVFIFNTLLLFIPQLFVTSESKAFFTYLWVLPACVMVSLLFSYFVKETFSSGQKKAK